MKTQYRLLINWVALTCSSDNDALNIHEANYLRTSLSHLFQPCFLPSDYSKYTNRRSYLYILIYILQFPNIFLYFNHVAKPVFSTPPCEISNPEARHKYPESIREGSAAASFANEPTSIAVLLAAADPTTYLKCRSLR